MISQLNELKEVPNFLAKELARQEDLELIRNNKRVSTEAQRLGVHASRARNNTTNAFNYKPVDILKSAKGEQPVKLDQRKIMRVREIEMKHFERNYIKKGSRALSDLPDYLKRFEEPQKMSDVAKLAKQVLNGSYDEKKEDDWLNTIVYRHLPAHEKANYRAKHLKHLSLDYLEEKALKEKLRREKIALERKKI